MSIFKSFGNVAVMHMDDAVLANAGAMTDEQRRAMFAGGGGGRGPSVEHFGTNSPTGAPAPGVAQANYAGWTLAPGSDPTAGGYAEPAIMSPAAQGYPQGGGGPHSYQVKPQMIIFVGF
jgi:hypothetical protein